MTKVYVVTEYWYEDWNIVAVFDSEEKANQYTTTRKENGWSMLYSIKEINLNEGL